MFVQLVDLVGFVGAVDRAVSRAVGIKLRCGRRYEGDCYRD
jgi:hypothetical protein